MKIVIISDETLKEELRSKPVRDHVEYTWLDQIGVIRDYPNADAVLDLQFKPEPGRIALLAGFLPKPVLINSVAFELAGLHEDFIRINAWPTFLKRKICEIAVLNDKTKEVADWFFTELGWEKRFVPDRKGMVSPRIVAAIVNEAYFALGARVSDKEQIDIAMKLGTNYPYGPFAWSEKIGLEKIYELLCSLAGSDVRYTVAGAMYAELNHQPFSPEK